MSVALLLDAQNRDGGWPYARGVSWTEPTVYAVLALLRAGEKSAAERGLKWLRAIQHSDGGWPPQAGIDQSSWVTSLVALVPPAQLGLDAHARSVGWVGGLTGEESSGIYRLREWLLGQGPLTEREPPGWPWLAGTAAWVTPTSFAILALEKECRRKPNRQIEKRIASGRAFLLSRMCNGGGWNHGSVRALGYPSSAYPETTGMALAALRGVRSPQIEASTILARRFLGECRSADAWNWLRLGLRVQGQLPECPTPAGLRFRTVPEIAVDSLVTAALQTPNGDWV